MKDLAPTNSDRQPGVAEIAEYAQLSEDDVRAGLEALDSFATLSLDARLTDGDHGYSLADALGEPDTGFDLVVDREALKPALARLPERERTILYLRFFRDMTQSCIAERLGVSQMHVSRLLSSCCASLREEVLADASGAGDSPAREPSPTGVLTNRHHRGGTTSATGRGSARACRSGQVAPHAPRSAA